MLLPSATQQAADSVSGQHNSAKRSLSHEPSQAPAAAPGGSSELMA